MSHHLLLVIHLLSAAIWVGGHLFIAIRILPRALREKDAAIILTVEKAYEPIGIPALLLLVASGIWMATSYVPIQFWFSFSLPVERVISLKLLLLFSTVLLALSAQIRVIPALKKNRSKLNEMSLHIIGVTVIGVAMLVLGSFVRFGGV